MQRKSEEPEALQPPHAPHARSCSTHVPPSATVCTSAHTSPLPPRAQVKEVYLVYLLEQLEALKLRSAIVFVSTRRNCSLLQHLLAELGIKAAALHSGLPQRDRVAALDRFRAGVVPVLLATDVAARGLDIPDVDLVVNYDLPHLARDYVHRCVCGGSVCVVGWWMY